MCSSWLKKWFWLVALMYGFTWHHAHAGIQDGPDGVDPLGIVSNDSCMIPVIYTNIDLRTGSYIPKPKPILYTPAYVPSLTECFNGCYARQPIGCSLSWAEAWEDSTGQARCKCVWYCPNRGATVAEYRKSALSMEKRARA